MGKPEKMPIPAPPPANGTPSTAPPSGLGFLHSNEVIEAAKFRCRDEQEMQNLLQQCQLSTGVYNQEIEPEHETECVSFSRKNVMCLISHRYYCQCGACQWKWAKRARTKTHSRWSDAVKYDGEKTYNDFYGGQRNGMPGSGAFLRNPYQSRIISPYGMWGAGSGSMFRQWQPRPDPASHQTFIHQTIELNKELNEKAQYAVNAKEPGEDIWADSQDAILDFTDPSLAEDKVAESGQYLNKGAVPLNGPATDFAGEDEQMKMALRASMQDSKKVMSQEDEEMERAIQASLSDQTGSMSLSEQPKVETNPFIRIMQPSNGTPSNGINGHANEKSEKNMLAQDAKDDEANEKQSSLDHKTLSLPAMSARASSAQASIHAPVASTSSLAPAGKKASRLSRVFGSAQTKADHKEHVANKKQRELINRILAEEAGRWPDAEWRQIVATYQNKTGMASKIAHLRRHQPIQYLHMLRAGYFEPIPVAWADLNANPLKFTIEAKGGWRGITPAWRGYEDTAEERLYWVLNHTTRVAPGTRMKPDFISEMNMARERMSRAVEPPPEYASETDQCHLQHTSEGYSRQVMPPAFRPHDRPESADDDTMILLDVSGSMDFDPLRPVYNRYLITGYAPSLQPKNKDVAKAIIRRFTDAMASYDHLRHSEGYDLVTFSSHSQYIGRITHDNFDSMYSRVKVGGGTRVMTGWQRVKKMHFEKHKESAIYHPQWGWQAGPQTPILRLLLLLDGEAQDMDEFELDLLGLSWAHVTIFLIGVDGCPHHHRHANELQRISDVNHHVSFVDAVGNAPERFVTHELLKRHLGVDLSFAQFQRLEQLPEYTAV